MRNMNRRGMSEVIGITIFILLSVVAVGILYSSLVPFIKKSTDFSPLTSCADLASSPPEVEKITYNSATKKIEATVRNSLQEEVSDMKFVFSLPSGEQKSFQCSPVCGGDCVVPKLGGVKTYYFDFQESQPETMALFANNCEITSVSIN